MELSSYQQAIVEWQERHLFQGENLVVSGVAGCGKTSTLTALARCSPTDKRVASIAFNSSIAGTLKAKLPTHVASQTYHALGRRALVDTFGGFDLVERKVYDAIASDPAMKYLASKTAKLVSLCKANVIGHPTDEQLERLAILYDVELDNDDGSRNEAKILRMFKAGRSALEYCIDTPTSGDFDDMLFLPAILEDVKPRRYDLIYVDELQDTSYAQRLLVGKSTDDHSTIIGVGDRRQAIYAWRGAGIRSMDEFKEYFKAAELPLSLSYRCPSAVGKLVNAEFPDIAFEVPATAKTGCVASITHAEMLKRLAENDMVLCRVNADLVRLAFDLLRMGKRPVIKGKEIGKGIVLLIQKSHAVTVVEMLQWLEEWRAREVDKALRIEHEEKAQAVNDMFETVLALAEGVTQVDEVIWRCEEIFSDTRSGIILSTVHRAKGLEAENVFIIRPDLMPHPSAKREEDIEQEKNIRYVAITRSLNNLTFVSS